MLVMLLALLTLKTTCQRWKVALPMVCPTLVRATPLAPFYTGARAMVISTLPMMSVTLLLMGPSVTASTLSAGTGACLMSMPVLLMRVKKPFALLLTRRSMTQLTLPTRTCLVFLVFLVLPLSSTLDLAQLRLSLLAVMSTVNATLVPTLVV